MKILKIALLVLGGLLIVAAAFYAVAHVSTQARMNKVWDIEGEDLPVPWPLGEREIAALEAKLAAASPTAEHADAGAADAPEPQGGDDLAGTQEGSAPAAGAEPQAAAARQPIAPEILEKTAAERAVARGKHLVEARLGCVECHGADFGGAVVMDVPPVMGMIGSNLTTGKGGVGAELSVADWERQIRHGIGRDGTGNLMPSEDYALLSDREVSDVVAYARSLPPVDREMKPAYMGPVIRVMAFLGKAHLSVEKIDHSDKAASQPPPKGPNAEYGEHLAQVCRGCHGPGYAGGEMVGGDPSWPPASNLTPHPTGLEGWVYGDFEKAMREGVARDGRKLDRKAMPWPYFAKLEDVELKAIWAYLQTLEARPYGNL